jgi:hypothetical protein
MYYPLYRILLRTTIQRRRFQKKTMMKTTITTTEATTDPAHILSFSDASAMPLSAFRDASTGSYTTKASDAAIDSYASKVLKRESPPDAVIDPSVGPYVTSLLRCADLHDVKNLSSLEEYESLLELLEDQCNIEATVATNALQVIAEAVVNKILPLSEISTGNSKRSSIIMNLGLYTGGESSLDSFQSMREGLPNDGAVPSIAIDPYTPTAAGGPSPLKPDNLILGDLLGALDNPSPNLHRFMINSTGGNHSTTVGNYAPQQQQQHLTAGIRPQVFQFHSTPPRPPMPHPQRPLHQQTHTQQHHHLMSSPTPMAATAVSSSLYSVISNNSTTTPDANDFSPLDKANEFPPLGTSAEKPKKAKSGSAKKTASSTNGSSSLKGTPQRTSLSDKELAAALFRPARPRQNSIESEQDATSGGSSSSAQQMQHRSRGSSLGSYHAVSGMTYSQEQQQDEDNGKGVTPASDLLASGGGATDMAANDYYFQQQQLGSCVEILLSMNQELAEEAATVASLMAQLDLNVAQYIVDAAMTAPPICRHMLQEGCYRSDCQFSHDVDGHSCLFWIRGRCGKGASCKFLHGFNEKLLDGISFDPSPNTVSSTTAIRMDNQTQDMYPGYNGYPSYFQTSTVGDAPGSAYSSQMAPPSWQSPSLADSSASNSHSSGDASFSFANVASKGYDKNKFSDSSFPPPSYSTSTVPTVRIPQDLWNPHENRDAAVFHIPDPLERYQQVAATVRRKDVIDLHFQSTKTFAVVLSSILPTKLREVEEVWIVTGTGHHVGSKTHQKGGGALERAVVQWLTEEGYNFLQGKDRNGLGGALLVKR